MTGPRLAILVGAGASHGAGAVQPYPPPLGRDLYADLQNTLKPWAALPLDIHKLLREDFELGMEEIWRQWSRGGLDRQILNAFGVYFATFALPLGTANAYTRLAECIALNGLTSTTGIATLNYELLLEAGIMNAGLLVNYGGPPRSDTALTLWKPHGACNILADVQFEDVRLMTGEVEGLQMFDGPVRFARSNQEIVDYIGTQRSLPPVMSLYTRSKWVPLCGGLIDGFRASWADWARQADVIIVIGAAAYLTDAHVWDPVLAGTGEVWFVGGAGREYGEFSARLGDRLTHVGERFGDALPDLCARIERLAKAELQAG